MATLFDIIYRNSGASANDIEQIVARYPWWSAARLALYRSKATKSDAATQLTAELHYLGTIARHDVDIAKLTHLTTEDRIDKFLNLDSYRIVAEEGDAEDISKVEMGDDDELVSEELAEIYQNQGLYDEAIDTYRKLSLLNSEKSIYFAGLIAKIEEKRDNK
jgi:tetratricopeptide (TPR) repeat protein